MNTATAITALDHTSAHVGIHMPSQIRQARAKAPAAAPHFDRSAIMKAAWLDYRAAERKGWTGKGFDRRRWAYCLNWAWMLAKVAVNKVDEARAAEIRLAAIIASVNAEIEPKLADPRVEAIRDELHAIKYSDAFSATVADRERELRAELKRLTA